MSTFRSLARIAAEAAELLDPDWFGQLHDLSLAEQHAEGAAISAEVQKLRPPLFRMTDGTTAHPVGTLR
jgi:hypothetical protein